MVFPCIPPFSLSCHSQTDRKHEVPFFLPLQWKPEQLQVWQIDSSRNLLSLRGAAAHFFSVRGIWEGVLIPLGILRTIVHPPSFLCLFQNVCKPAEETRRPPTLQEIKQKIASYNSREKNCLGMKLVSGPAHPVLPSAPHPYLPSPHAHPTPTPGSTPSSCLAPPLSLWILGLPP